MKRRAFGCLMALAMTGCAHSWSSRSSGHNPVQPPAATPVGVPPSAVPCPLPKAAEATPESTDTRLPDGRHFGYIRSIDPGRNQLDFDLAQLFTGTTADRAAIEDHAITASDDCHVPNDYYIRNTNHDFRTLSYRSDVRITIVDWSHCCATTAGTRNAFATSFASGADHSTYKGPKSQYWLTVRNGTVIRIDEQYLP